MKSCEGLMVAAIVAVLSFSSPSTSRSLPQWSSSSGTDASGGGGSGGFGPPEGDTNNSPPKDTLYWSPLSGQVPPSWLLTLGPRESRAENFIRFGRSNGGVNDKTLANKKNNFIRLGRENPRQNNFIRLGRGGTGGQEEPPFYGGSSFGGVAGVRWPVDGSSGSSLRDASNDYGTLIN